MLRAMGAGVRPPAWWITEMDADLRGSGTHLAGRCSEGLLCRRRRIDSALAAGSWPMRFTLRRFERYAKRAAGHGLSHHGDGRVR